MHKSDLALQLLEEASKASSRSEAKEIAYKACLCDSSNSEAHIILSRLCDSFVEKEAALKMGDENPRLSYELGCLYLNEGLLRRACSCFVRSLAIESSCYYLLAALAQLEDKHIEDVYGEAIKDRDPRRFVRCSVPYLSYLYKCGYLDEAKELYREILNIEPGFASLLKGEEGSDEARRVLKNNAALINSTPSLIMWLNSIGEEKYD